jgi:hypothetical protein
MMHRENFKHRCAISNAFAALEDNSFSNHMFAWATSRYEDRLIRFTLKARGRHNQDAHFAVELGPH